MDGGELDHSAPAPLGGAGAGNMGLAVAWSPHRKESQSILLYTVQFPAFDENDSTSFQGSSHNCLSSLETSIPSVYNDNKSVIISNEADATLRSEVPEGLEGQSTSDVSSSSATLLSSIQPQNTFAVTSGESLISNSPTITSSASLTHTNSSHTPIVDSFSHRDEDIRKMIINREGREVELVTDSQGNLNCNPSKSGQIGAMSHFVTPNSMLLLDSSTNAGHNTLMSSVNSGINESHSDHPTMDKVEFVIDGTDEHGISYALDANNLSKMLTLHPLLSSEVSSAFGSKGAALVLEQGEDGELRVRRSSPIPEDCFQDLVGTDPRFLEFPLGSIIDDIPLKNDTRITELKQMEIYSPETEDANQQLLMHQAGSHLPNFDEHEHTSNLSSGYTISISSAPKNQPLKQQQQLQSHPQQQQQDQQQQQHPQTQPQSNHQVIKNHRPVLAEKTFKLENTINLSSDYPPKNDDRKSLDCNESYEHWTEDCSSCLSGDCINHVIQSISDKPVPSRAWASLPAILMVNTFTDTHLTQRAFGVFARKMIPKHTQFGPVEGVIMKMEDMKQFPDGCHMKGGEVEFIVESDTGAMHVIDLSDENSSNWMRFVRSAEITSEQNLALCQHGEYLYFRTIRDIQPRQELLLWYSNAYATRRNLPIEPPKGYKAINNHPWMCFKCNKSFSNSEDTQKHLNGHDSEQNENEDSSLKRVDGQTTNAVNKVKNGAEKTVRKLLFQCNMCVKSFPRKSSLCRHMQLHSLDRKLAIKKCNTKLGESASKDRHTRKDSTKKCGKKPEPEPENSSSNSFGCSKCSVVFGSQSLLSLHRYTHGPLTCLTNSSLNGEFLHNDGVSCPECFMVFPHMQNLIDHVTDHTKIAVSKRRIDPSKPFRCGKCYKGFANEERLQHHMLVHGSDETKPVQCKECLKRFLNNSALACHIKTHTNQSKIFDCPMCKKIFDNVLSLKEHVVVHSINGSFVCPYCNKLFSGYGPIRKHIRAFHCEKTQKCKLCNHDFPTSDKLRMHMLRHSDHREFLCANCGKQFKRRDKLNEHMKRMHESERPPKPQPILKAMKQKRPKKDAMKTKKSYENHRSDYERYVFKCHPCLQGFKRRGMLVNHLAKRHPNITPEQVPELNMPILKTTRDYFCQYCEKVYKSSSKRKAHILKYHPGAEIPVNKGKISSSSENSLIPFTQTAGTEAKQPQSCPWCYKQYATKAKLLQHQRSKHAEKSSPVKKGRSKSEKTSTMEIAIQSDSNSTGENLILTECTMTFMREFEDVGVQTAQVKKEDCRSGEGNVDLLSQAMSELGQHDYESSHQGTCDDLQFHHIMDTGASHIVVPKTVFLPYPPR